VSPNGRYVYVTNSEDAVSVVDTAAHEVRATIGVGSGPGHLAFSADGRRAYVTNTSSDDVSVIDTATARVVATVPVGSMPGDVAVVGSASISVPAPDNGGGCALTPRADSYGLGLLMIAVVLLVRRRLRREWAQRA